MKYLIALIIAAGAAFGLFYYSLPVEESAAYNREASETVVYETEVDSEADCDASETFDPERSVCVYECDTEEACKEYEDYISETYDSWADEYAKDPQPVQESEPSASAETEAQYRVNPGETTELITGARTDDHQVIWNQIAALSPDAFTNTYIELFEVFRDSEGDTLAYVDDEDGNGKWRVAVNIAGYQTSSDRERATTLIHELSHIVTLNSSQVAETGGTCAGFDTGSEGCAGPSSYLAQFVKRFWSVDDLELVGGGAGESNASAMYEQKPASFVTEYAATNPGEDIAESFALFILDQKSNPTTVAEEKVQFFYQFPALVSMREEMRSAITQGIVRARKASTQ